MVAPDQEYPVWVAHLLSARLSHAEGGRSDHSSAQHLEAQEKQEGLDAIEASVHKVAHEQVVGLRAVPADLEELQKVVKLAMDVSTCMSSSQDA